MSGKAFIGIDVAFAKRKFLPIVISRWESGQLRPYPLRSFPHMPPKGLGNASTLDDSVIQGFAIETVAYIRTVCNTLGVNPTAIALDAPSRPKPDGQKRRHSEVAMDQAGISCFATPSDSEFLMIKAKVRNHLSKRGAENRIPHSNQLWMLVGFELFTELSKIAPCIEVFPQAIVHRLGASSAHKSSQAGLAAQIKSIASATGWPHGAHPIKELREIAFAPAHDALDAYMSSWVASLGEDQREGLGTPPNDVIWVPKINKRSIAAAPSELQPVSSAGPLSQVKQEPVDPHSVQVEGKLGKLCPACGQKYFTRWPMGWDAHAAHKCTGLTPGTTEERKREFKTRFLRTHQ